MPKIAGQILFEVWEKEKQVINKPNFNPKGDRFIHMWERYVPEELRYAWNDLHWQTKTIAYMMGKEQADQEEYD